MSSAFERMLVVGCTNTLGRKISCTPSIVNSERQWVNYRFDLFSHLSCSPSVLSNLRKVERVS